MELGGVDETGLSERYPGDEFESREFSRASFNAAYCETPILEISQRCIVRF